MSAIKLQGIPSTYQGWVVIPIMDGEGKIFVGQTGKVTGVSNWAFHVWMKSSIDSSDATRVLTLPNGSNGALAVLGDTLYAVEVKKGGGIWMNKIEQYVPLKQTSTPNPEPSPAPSDGVVISVEVAQQLHDEIQGQL